MKRALLVVIAMSCTRTMDTGPTADATPAHGDGAHGDGAVVIDAPVSGVDAALPCKQASTLHTDGHHNPGQDCMGLCHFHGFAFAGTLMQADGHTPAVGATVTVVDANNNSQDLVA